MTYPKWYYYRGGVSDRDLVMSRMRCIPPSLKEEVSRKYEKLYLQNGHHDVSEGRRAANEYLEGVAKIYRSKNVQQAPVIQYQENTRQVHSAIAGKTTAPSKYQGKILRDAFGE